MSTRPAPQELPTSVVLKRRLLGLSVLLLVLFLLSILLRALGQPELAQDDGLQTVVVPLGGGELPPVVAAPESGPVPEAAATESIIETSPLPGSASESVAEPPTAKEVSSVSAPPAVASAAVTPLAKPTAKTPVSERPAKAPGAIARWYVVLGTFSDATNAKALVLRARQSGFRAEVIPAKSGGSVRHRVRAGPFKTESEGQGARATMIVEGMTGARLVKEP